MISPQSRMHRTLKGLEQFDTEVSDTTLEELQIAPLLSDGEHVLGIYRNKKQHSFFLVTDRALILSTESLPCRFDFSEMKSSVIVADEKSTASEIQIKLRNGKLAIVVVDGGNGKFRDVFECGRFMARVIEDQHNASGSNV